MLQEQGRLLLVAGYSVDNKTPRIRSPGNLWRNRGEMVYLKVNIYISDVLQILLKCLPL